MMLRYILLLTIVSVLAGCLQTENSSSLDGFVPVGEGLFGEVNQIFSNRCSAPCHDFHTYNEQFFIDTNRLTPGDPENSPIYYRIMGSMGPNGTKNMPTFGTISASERDLIYQWILEM